MPSVSVISKNPSSPFRDPLVWGVLVAGVLYDCCLDFVGEAVHRELSTI